MTWLGYSRVSRVGGRGDRLISPDVQQRRIAGYAEARGLKVEMLEPELDGSGGTAVRPILGQAMRRIEDGEAEGIIVAQLDRLSRMALADALGVIESIEASGGGVIAVAENVDPTTPEGRLARNIFLSMAEHQRARYSEHIATSKRQAVERGIWPMPVVPRGYRIGEDRRLVPGEDADAVREAFRLRAGGTSWAKIAALLGCGHSGAGKTVRNRVYLGEIHLDVEGRPVVNLAAHEPLVSRAEWEAAQIAHPAPPRGSAPSLLAGIIRCAACSRQMSPGGGVYRCFPRKASGDCPEPTQINSGPVEEHVEAILLAALERLQVVGRPAEAGATERDELEAAEAELAAYQQAVDASGVGPELLAAGIRQRAERIEAARVALGRVQASSGVAPVGGREVYERLGIEERRHVLRGAVGVVWVRKGRGVEGRVKVIEAGAEPLNLSRPGVSSPPVRIEWGDLPGEIGVPAPEGGGEGGSE